MTKARPKKTRPRPHPTMTDAEAVEQAAIVNSDLEWATEAKLTQAGKDKPKGKTKGNDD
jgi:hypothetical protein